MNYYKLLPALLLLSCTNPEKKPADKEGPATSVTDCYRYVNNKDTVTLKIIHVGENKTGTLVYNFFEKDRNEGTIQGYIKNGLLIADYSYRAEGMQSVRQLAFKKIGENWVEGYGDLDILGDTVRYLNIDSLDYSKGIVLKPFDCKESPH